MMGAGKSEVGRLLARRIGIPHIELDEVIEQSAGLSIAEIFRLEGEERFRDLEEQALAQATAAGGAVISCGGGAVLRESNRRCLREKCYTIWLKAGGEALFRRLCGSPRSVRPLLQGEDLKSRIESLLAARERFYRQADLTLPTDDLSPDEICTQIQRLILGWEKRS
jgi:shikimate kinase